MNILITGGAGFIGTNFSEFVFKRGHTPIVFDNFSKSSSRENLSYLKSIGISDITTGDISNYEDILRMNKPIDVIVHLAANCSTSRSIENPIRDFEDNALGTLTVLEYAKILKVPLIYASTCKVYSSDSVNKISSGIINEKCPTISSARSPYGTSKLTGELYCQEYHEIYGVPTVINRLSTIFGPRQYGSEEAGWIYWFCEAKKKGNTLIIYGSGNQVRDALWVEDLCELLLLQIQDIKIFEGEVFNVGGGKENAVSLKEIIAYLNKKGGEPLKVKHTNARPADFNVYISDMSKLFSYILWRPKKSVYEGIDIIYDLI